MLARSLSRVTIIGGPKAAMPAPRAGSCPVPSSCQICFWAAVSSTSQHAGSADLGLDKPTVVPAWRRWRQRREGAPNRPTHARAGCRPLSRRVIWRNLSIQSAATVQTEVGTPSHCPGPCSPSACPAAREATGTWRARENHLAIAEPAARRDQGSELRFSTERVTGIEPALSAWEADVLPLNYTRATARPGKPGRCGRRRSPYRRPRHER